MSNKELTTTQYGQRALLRELVNSLSLKGWTLRTVRSDSREYRANCTPDFAFRRLISSGEICLEFHRAGATGWIQLMDNEDPIHDYSTTPGFCKIVERFKLT